MKTDKAQRKNPAFLLTFLALTTISVIVICYSFYRQKQYTLESARHMMDSEKSKLQYAIESRLLNAQVLEMMVISHQGEIVDFEEMAASLFWEDSSVKSIQLAPDGIVTHVYPKEGNEKAYLNLFTDTMRKAEAERARDTGQVTLDGPYALSQGGMGLVARNPIYLTKEDGSQDFWGFSIVVFNVPEIFDVANLDLLTSQNYNYRLWRRLPGTEDVQVITENTNRPLKDAIQSEVHVPNAVWYLDIEPLKGWVSPHQFFITIAMMLLIETIVLVVMWFRKREKETQTLHGEKIARQNEALKGAYEAAERANRAKSEFLSGMSHDIRTPLNGIIGMAAIASAHKEDPDRVGDCLEKISASSRHLLGLINEVLDMSKIESGKVTLSEEEFNLADLLDNLVQLIQPEIKAKKHELVIRNHNIIHEDVIGDSLRIQQVFVNIVGNAIKYTPDSGKIEIEVSELESNSPKIGAYRFVCRDNGIGISKEFAKTIFDPFSREKDLRVDKIQGTGLGMAITKNIVQMMDGSIEVESQLGEGSVFTVVMRLKLQQKEQKAVDGFLGLPVLVVDDDKSICESTCLILEEIGMEGDFALSGREAVEKVREAHKKKKDYYAVIMDWKMPDMDGLDTTKSIRKAVGEDVPVIVFSAYDWSEVEKSARAAGVDAFISKPLFKSKLIHIFHAMKNQHPGEEKEDALEALGKMDFGGRNLLLVEDNELNREIACEIISMTGIQIHTAENGEEAVKKFQQSQWGYYDMILMDVQMPVMNGYDATMTIRAMDRPDAKTVPIIAMTADAFAEDVEKALSSQMNEHLAKPLDIQKLADVMCRWLLQKETSDETDKDKAPWE